MSCEKSKRTIVKNTVLYAFLMLQNAYDTTGAKLGINHREQLL
jgi:hypothetical protein